MYKNSGKWRKNSKHPSKYYGYFRPAVGSSGIIFYVLTTGSCFLAYKHFYRQGFLGKTKNYFRGSFIEKKLGTVLQVSTGRNLCEIIKCTRVKTANILQYCWYIHKIINVEPCVLLRARYRSRYSNWLRAGRSGD